MARLTLRLIWQRVNKRRRMLNCAKQSILASAAITLNFWLGAVSLALFKTHQSLRQQRQPVRVKRQSNHSTCQRGWGTESPISQIYLVQSRTPKLLSLHGFTCRARMRKRIARNAPRRPGPTQSFNAVFDMANLQ